jgi:hypothetical protein
MTTLTTGDTPKMLRETLAMASTALQRYEGMDVLNAGHVDRIRRLIAECDRHRPLGPDGTHGDRHTLTCACEDVPTGLLPPTPWSPEDARDRNAVFCALDAMADEAEAAAASGIEPVLNTYLAGSLRMRAAFIRTGVIPAITKRVPRLT